MSNLLNIKPLNISEINPNPLNLKFYNLDDIKLNFNDFENIIPNIKTLVNENKKKNSRERQLKINEASKKTRMKKKIHMKLMSNHIRNLHKILKSIELYNQDLLVEINNFDERILI
jgi:hypothetical protein